MYDEDVNKEMAKQRNVANNANTIRAAADMASNTANPYAKAIGKAVKAADKISGGKSSEFLGKKLDQANKFAPGGRLAQRAMNKMSENGTASRINSAMNKKNSSSPVGAKSNMKSNAVAPGKGNSFLDRREVEDKTSGGGDVTVKASADILKIGIAVMPFALIFIVFLGLIVAGSQIFVQVIGLRQADAVSSSQADTAIRENGSAGLSDEINDGNADEGRVEINNENVYEGRASNSIGYIEVNDIFIEDDTSVNIYRKKYYTQNLFAKTKDYDEEDLNELKDFYSDINSYEDEGYNMDTVYKFFFKLYYIQKHYNSYNIVLDMPLIMAVVTRQSENINDVFISNIKEYKVSLQEKNDLFKPDKDWSTYVSTKTYSAHDIEVLAQNMVEKSSNSGYEIKSSTEYKEFLKNFIKQKYYSEYEYDSVSSEINKMITEIYDAKEQYNDLMGEKTTVEKIITVSNNLFWWPVGSLETEEINGVLYAKGNPSSIKVTSDFGNQEAFRTSKHGGIDIGNMGNGPGVLNIIAVKSGEVIYPTSDSQTMYGDNGYYGNRDGGGFGNYVKIKHSDGSYTVYAHLAKGSITVRAGDVVDQGQVIGKMGNSGSSTGTHLHFEVRIGSDSHAGRVYPLDYVDPNNPRPMSYGGGNSFSLTTTSLSKEEFVARMNDYYLRTKKQGFYNNFVVNAEEVYDVSLANNVNPEMVVVTAGTEQSWTLSAACQYTNNYWGIGITNGKGCNSGGKYDSLAEGIAAYAKVLSSYNEYGKYAEAITNIYNERASASCDSSGHGLPGTLEGMQSIYSHIGTYRYNPGSWGLGGCKYLNIIYGANYCSTVATCAGSTNCSVESKTTTCEQNDYTAWQIKKKIQLRYDIFGL